MYENSILVGNEEICKQIAYVLNIKKYKILENLDNIDKYKNHKIILCDSTNQKKTNKNMINLKNIYKEVNKEYYKKYFKIPAYPNNSIKNFLKNIIYILNFIRPTFKNIKIINKIQVRYLKTSEMLIKTLNSVAIDIKCDNLEKTCNIDFNGNMWGCCPGWIQIPFGNIKSQEKNNFYNSYLSRIIKLSSLNNTYCFCDLNQCRFNHKPQKSQQLNIKNTKNYPEKLIISIDRSCNLKCKSCRNCYYHSNKKEKVYIDEIANSIIDTNWLDKTIIVLAGQGEVFFSDSYKKILTTDKKRKDIEILTNGTLFNKKNWELIENKYENIYVFISIDAANKETYKKLRCGNFDQLLKNLEMLKNLRLQNKIKRFQFNFVVQKDNYKEMIKFIQMAKDLNVDHIQFTKLNNWGTYSKSEYLEKSLIIDDKYLDYEFYKFLKNPIFNDKMIDLTSFEVLIKNSDNYYNKTKKL